MFTMTPDPMFTMTQPHMTQREIVLETLHHYGLGGRFGYEKLAHGYACSYLDPLTGNRCAVGRCLQTTRHDDRGASVDHIGLEQKDLMPRYQGHPIEFWRNLQRLHDFAAQQDWASIKMALRDLKFQHEQEDPRFRLKYPAFFYAVS